MSNEIEPIIDNVTEIIAVAIFLLAVFRSVTIGRALVNRVYRNRAYFSGAILLFTVLQSLIPDSWLVAGIPIYIPTYFLLLFLLLVFVDSTILVALDMDFFHRNTLRWRRGRLVAYAAFIVDVVVILVAYYVMGLSTKPAWVISLMHSEAKGAVVVSLVAVFLYSASAIIVASRRVAYSPMRRFLAYAGTILLIFIVTTLISNYTSIFAVDILSDLLGVAVAYVSYLMVMSLSPLAKVEKEATVPASNQRS